MPRARVNSAVELEYEEFGTGEPMVLIMGIGAQMIVWRTEFCQQLADLGFRVIRFDNRDVGLSSKLRGQRAPSFYSALGRRLVGASVKSPYTLLDMADDVAGLLDALGIERAHVAGVSLGGMIAQTFAIAHPHRARSVASIMSTTGELRYSMPTPNALRALLGKPARTAQDAVDNARLFYSTCGSKGFDIDWEWTEKLAVQSFERCYYPAGFLRQFSALMATPTRGEALRFVRAPTAVVHGSDDNLIPPAGGRATARAVPEASFHLIEGMGHDMPRGAWPQIHQVLSDNAARAR